MQVKLNSLLHPHNILDNFILLIVKFLFCRFKVMNPIQFVQPYAMDVV